MSRRQLALVGGLVLSLSGFFALVSPANADVSCAGTEPKVTEGASDAGGTLIEFIVNCQGNEKVGTDVSATIEDASGGEVLIFRATVEKTVSGNLFDREAIHLPPLPAVPTVCVTVDGQKVCVPPAI